jgi:hypothetical protein
MLTLLIVVLSLLNIHLLLATVRVSRISYAPMLPRAIDNLYENFNIKSCYKPSHPIITLSDDTGSSHCIIDFIPSDRRNLSVLVKLALGFSALGEVRMNYIGDDNRNFVNQVEQIRLNWNRQLNLYNNNCIHFKDYIVNTCTTVK